MLFIGSQEKGFFAETVAQEMGMNISFIPGNSSIYAQEDRIMLSTCKYMIFELEQYVEQTYVVATEILKLKNATNAEAIIFAPGLTEEHNAVIELMRYGINKFIFTLTLAERKEELRAILLGNEFKREHIVAAETQKQIIIKTNLKSIAIAGAMTRTGTTTQAIQLAKYLIQKGYNACYIETNPSHYVERLAEWYSEDECKVEKRPDARGRERIFKITVGHLDMFCNMDFLPEILTMNYDYFIYDYGVYTNPDFNKISFSEKSVKIITCGCEPDELECTKNILENVFYDEVNYIFSFVPEEDQAELKLLMDEKADHTFFATYTPDKFRFTGNVMYEELMPMVQKEEQMTEKQKGRLKELFRRRKHG